METLLQSLELQDLVARVQEEGSFELAAQAFRWGLPIEGSGAPSRAAKRDVKHTLGTDAADAADVLMQLWC